MFKLKSAIFVIITIALVVSGTAWAAWDEPGAAPTGNNRPRPLNVSDEFQQKEGNLDLGTNTTGLYADYALIIRNKALVFGNPAGNVVGFKAPATAPSTSIIWSLPNANAPDDGYYLTSDASGQLKWKKLMDLTTNDPDWTYWPDNNDPLNATSISSKVLTRIGEGGTRDLAGGPGDLYVQAESEFDGLAFFSYKVGIGTATPNSDSQLHVKNTLANAEIDIQSIDGVGNQWGLYVERNAPNQNELRLWQGDNNAIFYPNGDFKIRRLFRDKNGSIGNTNYLLGRDDTGMIWVDPSAAFNDNDWVKDSTGFLYPHSSGSKNVRVGDSWTNLTIANGAGDLYVQNDLEVDGSALIGAAATPTLPLDFTLQVAGHVGPNTTSAYDLGSASKRWRGVYADNIYISGDISTNFQTGSVVFQGAAGKLAQDNPNFFWDDANNRLGLGLNNPAFRLDVKGNLRLPNTALDGSEGILYLGDSRFMSNSGDIYSDSGESEPSNTFVGRGAGSLSDWATDNTSLGFKSLAANTYFRNTAIGSNSLRYNDGADNTAVGALTLYNNTTGSENVALGSLSLLWNQGSRNTAVGAGALGGRWPSGSTTSFSNLVAVGYQALQNNSTGTNNTAIGVYAGQSNGAGSRNAFFGNNAGLSNTSGNQNIYIGYSSGRLNSTGQGNVMIGNTAGENNPGSGNIFLGNNAGQSDNTSSYRLYIEPSNANGDNALITGQFYNGSNTPYVRLNGLTGFSPRGTTPFTPSKLVHIYQPAGNNAEMAIQSVSGADRHWGVYQDRNSEGLRFWNNNITDENKNLMTLAFYGTNKMSPAIGIGTVNPEYHLELHSQLGTSDNVLALSSYTDSALGQTTGGQTGTPSDILFVGGRYNSSGLYEKKPMANINASFAFFDGNANDYSHAKLSIQTLNNTGGLADTIVARDVKVGIGGDIESARTLKVHGVLEATGYFGNDGGIDYEGASTYICAAQCTATACNNYLHRFVDGLYICSCAATPVNGCSGCTCGD